MKWLMEKIDALAENKLFFVGYLFFFTVSLFLCVNADIIVPSKIVDTSYKVLRASDYPLVRYCLIGMALTHFAGGVAFFFQLCAKKLDW